ncbi:MAG: Wzz/FepE/Etk N-terminal domain-containing protein [Planctomycetota bacterium]
MPDIGLPTNQLFDFILLLKRKLWWMIIPALAGVAGSLVALIFIPKRYESWTKVEVHDVRFEDDPQFKNAQLSPYKDLQNVSARILSTDALIKVISEVLQWGDYLAIARNPEKRKTYLEEVVERTKIDRAKKDKDQGNDYITITYKDEDPRRAASFVMALREHWTSDSRQSLHDQIQSELNEDQKQLDRLNTELDSILSKIKVWQEQYKISPKLPSDRRTTTEDDWVILAYQKAKSELVQLEADVKIAEEKYNSAANRQAVTIRYIDVRPDAVSPTAPPDGSATKIQMDKLTELRSQKSDVEGKLAPLGKSHSKYKTLKKEVERLGKEIKVAEEILKKAGVVTTDATGAPMAKQQVVNPEWVARKQEADRAEEEYELKKTLFKQKEAQTAELEIMQRARPQIYSTYRTLEMNEDIAQKQYKEAAEKVERKKKLLQSINSIAGNPYRILDDAVPAEKPTEPNIALIIIIGIVGGAGLGLAWIFTREFVRASFRSVDDASASLSLPILGIVNRMVTSREIRRARIRSVFGITTSLAVILIISTFAGVYLIDPKRIPPQVRNMIENVKQTFK